MAMEGSIPEFVIQKAKHQAQHLQEMVIEAQKNEDAREKALRSYSKQHRAKLEERFDLERNDEALKITRMRTDHIALLNWEVQQQTERVRNYRKKGSFLPPDDGDKYIPGSTCKDFGFLKQMYEKLETQGTVVPSNAKSQNQLMQANRLSRGIKNYPNIPERSDLLKQRDQILQRLSELALHDHDNYSTPSRSSRLNTSRSNRSDISGATFCDRSSENSRLSSSRTPRNIPKLKMRQLNR